MPFRNYHQFDTPTVRLMRFAYDAALRQLGIDGDHPMSGRIAARIAICADTGERDPAKLCKAALNEIDPALAVTRFRPGSREGA